MRAQSLECWALTMTLLSVGACIEGSTPTPTPGTPPVTVPGAQDAASPGAPTPGDAGWLGADAGLGSLGSVDAGPANGATDAGEGEADAATTVPDAASADAGAPSAPPPEPVAAPYVWGFGVGVSDMAAAVAYFTDVMKLSVEKEGVRRDDRTETVLYAGQAKRGARLVLMRFDDGRATEKITAKLVWQASDAQEVTNAASKYPGYVSRNDFLVSQFDGPDTYIQEVGSIFDSGGSGITVPYLIALGFSVSDLAASRSFYTSLGMTDSSTGTFPVTDATGSATITEYTARFTTGSALVLQDWSPTRNSKDNPVKSVWFVPDAQAVADKLVAGGGTVVRPAERSPVYDQRLVIIAKDRDGYGIELVQ
jgi:catechol 2,3-dioxygenase-like lactoylglutathione lyase family enzyme